MPGVSNAQAVTKITYKTDCVEPLVKPITFEFTLSIFAYVFTYIIVTHISTLLLNYKIFFIKFLLFTYICK